MEGSKNIHFIGDELTVTGMRLGGMKKVHTANKGNVGEILEEVSQTSDNILITQGLAEHIPEEINELRDEDKMVVEIPDQTGGGEGYVNKLIKEVIGFKLKR